jgi:predicted dehydrogenase
VIGVGHLGKEHARILSSLPDVELVGVADLNRDVALDVARRCRTTAYGDYRSLLHRVDAAVIAAPSVHHHALASELLRRGIAVLVEKPLAVTLEQADDVVALAHRHGSLLQVGHIERFNPAFEELERHAFRPQAVACERQGAYTGRSTDIGAVLDLMIHDIDLLLSIVRSPVRTVHAVGMSVLGVHEDVVQAHVVFANDCVAHLTANRIGLTPSRRMHAWGQKAFATVDFAGRSLTVVEPTDELPCTGLDLARLDPAKLKEEVFGRYLRVSRFDRPDGDQLTRELQEFVSCVRTGTRPRVSGAEARDAIALAMQVLDSMRMHQGQSTSPRLAAA